MSLITKAISFATMITIFSGYIWYINGMPDIETMRDYPYRERWESFGRISSQEDTTPPHPHLYTQSKSQEYYLKKFERFSCEHHSVMDTWLSQFIHLKSKCEDMEIMAQVNDWIRQGNIMVISLDVASHENIWVWYMKTTPK